MLTPCAIKCSSRSKEVVIVTVVWFCDPSTHYNVISSLVVRKPVFGVSDLSHTKWAVQSQKMARGFKFCI